MKHLISISAMAAWLLVYGTVLRGQTLINIDTITYHGATDTVDYLPLVMNTNNVIVISGNNKISSSQYNAETAAQLSNGINWWSTAFSGGSNRSFIIANCRDNVGNIYTAGATRTGTNLDFLIIKYDPAGTQLWSTTYNGPTSMNDVATAITINDQTGDIFVTGGSEGSITTIIDFATIKLDQSGNIVWTKRYDYNGVIDVPTGIYFDPDGTDDIFVAGSSGSTFNDIDFCTVRYRESDGFQLGVNRTTNPAGSGQDKVFSMVSDTLGNLYIAGTTFDGSDYDLQIVKLDTALNTIFNVKYDGYGLDDSGIGLDLDDSLHVYVTGFLSTSVTQRELVLLKYDSNGNLLWTAKKQMLPGLSSAEGIVVRVKNDDEIFVGGNFIINSNQNIGILRYDRFGNQTLEKFYDGPSGLKDQFMDLEFGSGNIVYVSARSYNSTTALNDNILIQYRYKDHPLVVTTNTNNVKYASHEILVRFNKPAMKLAAINDRNLQFGKLGDFVVDSTCQKIEDALDPENELRINAKNLNARKIFIDMTVADSLAISRMGDTVKVPDFYCMLMIELPQSLNVVNSSDTIHNIKPDINYAQVNIVYAPHSIPNDPYYPLQESLYPNINSANSDCNIEQAWNITTGKQFVKVGILDTGIDFNHEDIAFNFVGGHDFVTSSAATATDPFSHGTSVAGIIGAVRNNAKGVAGVAGGDYSTLTRGASLFSFRICPNDCPDNLIVSGIIGSAQGWGMHILNNSYGGWGTPYDNATVDAINFANSLGVVQVFSKGNDDMGTAGSYPGDYKDQTIINVGASQVGGLRKTNNVSCNHSNYGYPMDFLAPGTAALIVAPKPGGTGNQYQSFGCTSGAAPHASGVAALMLSYWNSSSPSWDNLVHEDCEAIMRRTCSDVVVTNNPNYVVGYDLESGAGRLNGLDALQKIQKPLFNIRHINPSHYITSMSTSTASAGSSIRYFPSYSWLSGNYYVVQAIEVTHTYNYTIPSTEQVVSAWPLYKASSGWPNYSGPVCTNEPWYCQLVSFSSTQAVLKNYTFSVTTQWGQQLGFFPAPPNQLVAAFSLYTFDPTTLGLTKDTKPFNEFTVYPNPNQGEFMINFNARRTERANINVLDVQGKIIYQTELDVTAGINSNIAISLPHQKKGLYFVEVKYQGGERQTSKISIN